MMSYNVKVVSRPLAFAFSEKDARKAGNINLRNVRKIEL